MAGTDTSPGSAVAKLVDALWKFVSTEVDYFDQPRGDAWKRRILAFAPLAADAGRVGWLVSKEADPYYLAAVAWHESRLNPQAIDPAATSIGLMQVHVGNVRWLPNMDPAWGGVTLAELWRPVSNVEGGYVILAHYKHKCGSSPVLWLTAYRYGHCRAPDAEGRKRAALARRLLAG